jgi:mRNA interferase YafQ
MRQIKLTHGFKQDLRRVKANPAHSDINEKIEHVTHLLATDMPLPVSYVDHAMKGKWKGFRDCHVRPDVVLIYRKTPGILILVRLGSHSELKI